MSLKQVNPPLALALTLALTLACLSSLTHAAKEAEDRTPAGHTKDSIESIKAAIADGSAVLIDVREQSEWNAGHLKVATLVSLSEIKEAVNDKKNGARKVAQLLPKDKTIYFHCKSGGRVLVAEKLLLKFDLDIRPLQLGYSALLKEGFRKAK